MRNLKLNATAAGIALALSGVAHAVPQGLGVEVFMSGASAPSNMLRENVVQFACDHTAGNPISVFVDSAVQVPGGGNKLLAEPILEHKSFWVVQCTANSSMGSAAGKTMAFYKSDVGGSGNGTTPIKNRVPVQFMDADTNKCNLLVSGQADGSGASAATYDLYTCGQTNLVQQIPDFGASDVEASKFVGPLAPPSGGFVNDGTVQEKTGPGLVFGIVVSTALRDKLQADQIASGMIPASVTCDATTKENVECMPSLPSTVIRSLTTGKYNNWSDVKVYGSALTVPASWSDPKKNNVHLCRRVQGSGTHAEYLIHYHRTVCYTNAQQMLSQPGNGAGFFGAGPLVYEGSSSGTLGSCLDVLDKGTVGLTTTKITPNIAAGSQSFAIGYQSTEKNMKLAKNYRFVKVDGVAPTLANAIKGDYRQVYYSGFQNRLTGYDTGPLRASITTARNADIDAIFNNATNINSNVVAVLDKGFVHNWGRAGFLTPDAIAATVFTVGDPRTPWTREDAAGGADSCQPLFKK